MTNPTNRVAGYFNQASRRTVFLAIAGIAAFFLLMALLPRGAEAEHAGQPSFILEHDGVSEIVTPLVGSLPVVDF